MFNSIFSSLFIFLLIFSPLAYGSVTALHTTIMETTIALLILLWFCEITHKKSPYFLKSNFFLPVFLFLAVIILQIIPFPSYLLRLISAGNYRFYKNFLPSGAEGMFLTLSIYPNSTMGELLRTVSYLGVFALVIKKIEHKGQINFVINTIIFVGVFISIFGIFQKYTHSSSIYWFDPSVSASTSFGPFVNRNNFSGYINMVIPLTLGYFLTDLSMSKRLIYGFCIGIMSLALFMSLSKAGVLVYILVSICMLLVSVFRNILKEKAKILLIWFFMVVFLSIIFTGSKTVFQRLFTFFKYDTYPFLGHGYYWLDILRIWKDFPVFGTGLGTFGSISSVYKTPPVQNLFLYAHNDFLQLLSETGFLGVVSASLFFIFYFKSVLVAWVKRHDHYVIFLALGGMASIFGMLVYSLLDFNLHIPANAFLFFVIMALVYRLVHSKFHDVAIK